MRAGGHRALASFSADLRAANDDGCGSLSLRWLQFRSMRELPVLPLAGLNLKPAPVQ